MAGERSTVEILRAARERVGDPARWTAGEYARKSDGRECEPHASDAVCWCDAGAVYAELGLGIRADRDYLRRPTIEFLNSAAREQEGSISQINDRGHDEALALFDRAIELAVSAEEAH